MGECLPSMSIVESHYHILIQAVIQLVCWRYIFNLTRQYVTNNCTNKQWFRRWSSKPNGMGGETGDDMVIEQCVLLTHWDAFYLESHQSFVIGALSEFAYEALDMGNYIKKYLNM